MIALALAFVAVAVAAQLPVAVLGERHVVARGRTRRCEPCAERCAGSVIVTCAAGQWLRGIDCASHGARCSIEPDGYAICVHPGGAS